MIVLLSYSTSLLASDYQHSSTGERDSVLISYNDLRLANSKLIELVYEKQITSKLKTKIHNDSITINNLNIKVDKVEKKNKRLKKTRNSFGIISLIAISSTIAFILK